MTEDQEGLVGSYHDGCRTKELFKLLNDEQELVRLNKHRRTHWTQEMLNEVLITAIKMRMRWEHNLQSSTAATISAAQRSTGPPSSTTLTS